MATSKERQPPNIGHVLMKPNTFYSINIITNIEKKDSVQRPLKSHEIFFYGSGIISNLFGN